MKANFFRPAVAVFEAVFLPFMGTRLAKLHIVVPPAPLDESLPVVFVSNHVSWWDGFLLRALHRRLRPQAGFYTIMLERELRKHPYFRLMGCVGIEPGKEGSFDRAIDAVASRRGTDPGFCLSFFPQGRIWPATRRPLGFRTGIVHLLERLAPLQVVPVSLRIEPLNTMSPHAFVLAGAPRKIGPGQRIPTTKELESLVESTMDDLASRLERLGESATKGIAA